MFLFCYYFCFTVVVAYIVTDSVIGHGLLYSARKQVNYYYY
jgi:hypothetical protein